MSRSVQVTLPGLTCTATEAEAMVSVVLDGCADQLSAEKLAEFFHSVHELALERTAASAVVDVRQLEFMNSSAFKVLVTWVSEILDLTPDRRYGVRIRSNPGIPWQRRSLQSLQYFAVDLITVE